MINPYSGTHPALINKPYIDNLDTHNIHVISTIILHAARYRQGLYGSEAKQTLSERQLMYVGHNTDSYRVGYSKIPLPPSPRCGDLNPYPKRVKVLSMRKNESILKTTEYVHTITGYGGVYGAD